MRLLGTGCYYKAVRYPARETPTSQTTMIPILDFWSGSKPALDQNIPTGSKKQTAKYARRKDLILAWPRYRLVFTLCLLAQT